MKKIVLIAAAVLGLSIAASAQPKAIGIRGFFEQWQLSYEHYLGDPNFLEFDLGMSRYANSNTGFDLVGTYNFMLARPDFTPRGDWGLYLGPGAAFGTYYSYNDDKEKGENKAYFGLVAQLGLEYTFWFPLQLSVDVRPLIPFGDRKFYMYPALSVRYSF
ncbi:MAG: hypothetical protein IJ578_01865 [Bacteroidales bacterium]|nr:hypothetical protein [Bacteroidales bacterium]